MKKKCSCRTIWRTDCVINASLYGTVYEALNREDEIGTVYDDKWN